MMKDTTNNQSIQNKISHPSAMGATLPLGRVLLSARRGVLFFAPLLIGANLLLAPLANASDTSRGSVCLKASWYSIESLEKEGTTKFSKNIMANGKPFNENALTCATRLFPLGASLTITNKKNNKTITVKVTDRIGKRFAKTRVDLSKAAFKQIADLKDGVIAIEVRRVW